MQWALAAAASPLVLVAARAVVAATVRHYTGKLLRRREDRRA